MPNFSVLISFSYSSMNLNVLCLDCLLTIKKMLKPYIDKFPTIRIKVYVLLGYLNFVKYQVIMIGILNVLDTNDYCQYH